MGVSLGWLGYGSDASGDGRDGIRFRVVEPVEGPTNANRTHLATNRRQTGGHLVPRSPGFHSKNVRQGVANFLY